MSASTGNSLTRLLLDIADMLVIADVKPGLARGLRDAAHALAEDHWSATLAHSTETRHFPPAVTEIVRELKLGREPKEILAKFDIHAPLDAAELVRVSGIGPKLAYSLVHDYGVTSLEQLEEAIESGRLLRARGFGVHRLARMLRDLKVLIEAKAGVPIGLALAVASTLREELRQIKGIDRVEITGAARRFCSISPFVELLVASEDASELKTWRIANRLLSEDSRLALCVDAGSRDVNVHVHLAKTTQFAPAWMRTTGDPTHQAVMEGLLAENGIQWMEDALVSSNGRLVSVESELGIYDLAGLPFLPPEVREGQGLLCPAASLVKAGDIQGDLHVHSDWSDGDLSLEDIVRTATQLGYAYIAVTDHSVSLSIANGLSVDRLKRQQEHIERLRKRSSIDILHGVEVDILSDGSLDLPEDMLWELDIVIASVHSAMHQPMARMTDRLLAAIRHPCVDIIGHLTGRMIGRRAAYEIDLERVVEEAISRGVVFELNANPNRLDLAEEPLRRASSLGMRIPINTDTHHIHEFAHMAYGVRMARRGWLTRGQVLNTLPPGELRARLHRSRARR